MKTVAGVFAAETQAVRALEDLHSADIDPHSVSVIARSREEAREVAAATGATAPKGAGAGAGLGAVFGGVAGWLVGIGALAIPGIGPVIAAGPIAAALGAAGTTAAAGAGVGAVAGGLIGALTGWGFSERQAHEYQDRIEHGELLLAVDVPDDRDTGRVEDILRRDGGDMVSTGSPRR